MTSRIFKVVEEVTVLDYRIEIGMVTLNFVGNGAIYLSDTLGSYSSIFWIEQ